VLLDAAAPVSGLGIPYHLTPVADRVQITGDDFVERCSFRAGDLDDSVSRRRDRHVGDVGSDVIRRDRLEQAGRKPDNVSIHTCIGDAAEEFHELGRAVPGYRLKRVLDYIGENLANDVSLSELAAVIGMSPHYFAELFKKSTGRSPHQYILMQRIERAKQELYEPGRSVIEVGLDAGFQNPSRFARVFKKFVGISPSRFQSEVQFNRRYYL